MAAAGRAGRIGTPPRGSSSNTARGSRPRIKVPLRRADRDRHVGSRLGANRFKKLCALREGQPNFVADDFHRVAEKPRAIDSLNAGVEGPGEEVQIVSEDCLWMS